MSEDRSNGSNGNQLGIPGGPMGPMARLMGDLGIKKAADSESPLDNVMAQIPQRGGPDELGLRKQADVQRAIYEKTVTARNQLDHIRTELDKLTNLADTVTPEDVIGAAGRLVGHGIPARELATILADMPTNAGQGLATWVQMHDQNARRQEAEVTRVRDIARHNLGVAAFRELAGEHVTNRARAVHSQMIQSAGQLAPRGQAQPTGGMPQPTILQSVGPPAQMGPGAEEAA